MFEIKIHTRSEFYPTYAKWCGEHDFPIIPIAWFPETCLVAYVGDLPSHCVWFYNTDSALGYFGYPASNKFMSSELKKGGMEFLYSEVLKYAKENHYLCVTSYSHPERSTVTKALEYNNFVLGDENASNYVKIL